MLSWLMARRFAIIFLFCIDSFAINTFWGGKLIPVKEVRKILTTAIVSDNRSWCTPAVQIGPKTFLTAAHCIPLLKDAMTIHIQGPQIDLDSHFKTISTSMLTDENSFSSEKCKHVFEGLSDGETMTELEMLACWGNDGQPDLAIIITEKIVNGPMLSLSKTAPFASERLNLLGYSPPCGGDLGYCRSTRFKFFGFINSQIVFSGVGEGYGGNSSAACGGESGGFYFRNRSNQGAELVAIHSEATGNENIHSQINGKNIFVPAHMAGGTNLTELRVQQWIEQVIASEEIKICGFNLQCSDLQLFNLL